MPPGQGGCKDTGHKAHLDNHANQCNPNHDEYRGHERRYTGKGNKADLVNHAKQLNPNNSLYKGNRSK